MHEIHHYKGNFQFFFYATNQIKLVKGLLADIFPEAAIKQARGKKLEQYDREKVFDLAEKLLNSLRCFKPLYLQVLFQELFEKNPEEVVLSYLVLKRVAEDISSRADFNIESDLAQTILLENLERDLGDHLE